MCDNPIWQDEHQESEQSRGIQTHVSGIDQEEHHSMLQKEYELRQSARGDFSGKQHELMQHSNIWVGDQKNKGELSP
jgi:hypothetical protein